MVLVAGNQAADNFALARLSGSESIDMDEMHTMTHRGFILSLIVDNARNG
jgi:hypothetical protein